MISLLAQTVRLVENQARKQSVDIEIQATKGSMSLIGDPGQLKQVFLNLILNALQAMPEGGGEIVLSAYQESSALQAGEPPRICVDVRDNGAGIPEETLKTVFDPLFTTKSEGTGLGLTISHGIIERHEGEIEIDSEVGEGTRVAIRLPAAMRGAPKAHELQRG